MEQYKLANMAHWASCNLIFQKAKYLKPRLVLGLACLLLAACGTEHTSKGVVNASDNAAKKQPNIIFIFADDWGFGDLSAHGSKMAHTPNIDKLASEGTDFYQFSVSSPVCSPSRVSVMTGQFPSRYNIEQHFATIEHHKRSKMPDWLDPQAPMLPRILRDAGYATAHFGKWHLTNVQIKDAPMPTEYGYDEYAAFNLPGENMPPAETADKAIDFITRNKDKPFFVNLWIHETHTPHYPEPSLMKEFEHLPEQQMVYAAIVAAGDRDVGKIMDTLKKLDIDDSTLVIFSSDNGPEYVTETKWMDDDSTGPGFGRYYSVGESGGLKGAKRSLYAGGVRVPFIARWPGVVPAGVTDQSSIITAVDLLPTFAGLAGANLPEGYQSDGQNVTHALQGKTFDRNKPIYWIWPPGLNHPNKESANWPAYGIQNGDWKLLVNDNLNATELYRVDDWDESEDLAAKYPEVIKALRDEMVALQQQFPAAQPARVMSTLRTKE